jgi:hypothetical protein
MYIYIYIYINIYIYMIMHTHTYIRIYANMLPHVSGHALLRACLVASTPLRACQAESQIDSFFFLGDAREYAASGIDAN